MSEITILPLQIKPWTKAGNYVLRVTADESFYNSSGIRIAAPGIKKPAAYKEVACTYDAANKILNVPEIVLDATTDSPDNQRARYREAAIYTDRGVFVYEILRDFSLWDDLNDELTWLEVQESSYASRPWTDVGQYSRRQVNALVNRIWKFLNIRPDSDEYPFSDGFTVKILTPVYGEIVSGLYDRLTSEAVNNGIETTIERIDYFVNGVYIGGSTNAGLDYPLVFKTDEESDGLNEIVARALDSEGNYYLSKPINVFVKNIPDPYQPLDTDLTDIAALTPSPGEFMVRGLTKWYNATTDQVKQYLGLDQINNQPQQPLNDNLSQIAALNPSPGHFIIRGLSSFFSATPAQAKGTLGLDQVDNIPANTIIDAALAAIRDDVANEGDTLAKLLAKINTLTTMVGDGTIDVDTAINKVSEVYTMLSGFSETVDLPALINAKVAANGAIVGATKTKLTYDTKGLVTGGSDATTDDIAEGITRFYFTAARVLAAQMTGLAPGTNTAIANGQTVKEMLQNLQAQINASSGSSTASNVGAAGTGLFISKTGVDLAFRKIKAGSNVAINPLVGGELEISSTQNISQSGAVFNADSMPDVSKAEDDEFLQTNNTLDPKWTVTRSGTITEESLNSRIKSVYFLRLGGTGKVSLKQSYAPGAADFSLTIANYLYPTSNYHQVALQVEDATAANFLTLLFAFVNGVSFTAHKMVANVQTFNIYNAVVTADVYSKSYLHLQRVGGLFEGWFSNNGTAWKRLFTAHNQAITVAKFSLTMETGSGSGGAANLPVHGGFDWVRRDWLFL